MRTLKEISDDVESCHIIAKLEIRAARGTALHAELRLLKNDGVTDPVELLKVKHRILTDLLGLDISSSRNAR